MNKTDAEFMQEMLDLAEGTHWAKHKLVCPVFKVKEVKFKNGNKVERYVRDENGNKIIEKMTYCMVGLALKVGDRINFNNSISEKSQIGRILNKIYELIQESCSYNTGLFESKISLIEEWNDSDDVDREDILKVLHNALEKELVND